MNKKFVYEYIWQDNDRNFRSKTKVTNSCIKNITSNEDAIWNYDGSSTGQAPGSDSEVYIRPVAIYKDPFRKSERFNSDKICFENYLVLCDTWLPNGEPHSDNTREISTKIFQDTYEHEPMFGIEQEFFFINPDIKKPLGFHNDMEKQGPYYCGVGKNKCYGRNLAENILFNALYCDLNITGMNFEVAPGQCEFQICDTGIKVCDDLLILRYIMVRTAEDHNIQINFHPKPVEGDWNGSGCHTNFSTKSMRGNGGLEHILTAIKKLEKKHGEHIECYGIDNDKRLTGKHETADINTFSYGVADRGASIRIPRFTNRDKKGYFEDRRPASNMDPYVVCSKILDTIVN